MSGPKVDTAELRRQELERLMKLRQNRQSLAKYIDEQIRNIMNCFTASSGDDSSIQSDCDAIVKLQGEYAEELKKLLEKVSAGDETLDCKGLKAECDSLLEGFSTSASSYLRIIAKSRENNQEYIRQKEMSAKQATLKRTEIRGITNNIPSQNSDTEISDEQINERIVAFEKDLSDFMQNNAVASVNKNSALGIYQEIKEIASSDFDKYKKSKRISRLYNDFVAICDNAEKDMALMKEVYEKYRLELFDCKSELRELSSFSCVKEIEEEILLAKERAQGFVSRDYIKRQIDDVMRIHGYNVVQSELLEEANSSGQVLYGVDNDTAIDVFVSQDNQVTMRVIGIGFDDQITAADNERLYQQQCAFCSMHPQITKELEMRGVILKAKKHLPPDRKYNKKIKTKTKSGTNKTSRAKEELKRAGLKTMHKE